jgi:hypothetical protein
MLAEQNAVPQQKYAGAALAHRQAPTHRAAVSMRQNHKTIIATKCKTAQCGENTERWPQWMNAAARMQEQRRHTAALTHSAALSMREHAHKVPPHYTVGCSITPCMHQAQRWHTAAP